ncbi:MAG TPA: hypothetical protein VFT34_04560 [Verrucomicrobiae bacterium]|nr:hypothetical protein [Verrucomicrobiae bacterium]
MNPRPGRSITVQTYDGSDVSNSIEFDPSPAMVAVQRRSLRRGNLILAEARPLGPPSGRYNCHGLVFASRRTNVPTVGLFDEGVIDDLLTRDVYEKISSLPQTGDIIVYRSDTGEIEHTGFVSRIEDISSVRIVFVWSKWGALEEYEHREKVCPYGNCTIEYWRLKR